MHLLCMDAGYEPSTPGSLSAEESLSNSSGLERNRDDEQLEPRSTKKREKNRDAARKSRQKQTERADELHQELQGLEQSNSAFQKEIAALKKELRHYETALERHEPHCCLRASASSSPAQLSVASSADCQASSGLPQASNSPSPPHSASSNPSMGLQTFNYIKKARLSPSASPPTTTTAASEIPTASSSSSVSSPVTIPYSVSFSTQPTPHSLFSQLPPITPRPANVLPVCAKPARSKTVHESSSASQGSSFTCPAFLMKLDSSLSASSGVHAPFSHLQARNTSTVLQDCSLTATQSYSSNFSGNLNSSHQPSAPRQEAARHALPVSSQVGVGPPLTSPFALKRRYSESVSAGSGSLLSLLTVPSPPKISQTTSSSFQGSASQAPLPPLPGPPEDPSLSELLEIDDWILSGINND